MSDDVSVGQKPWTAVRRASRRVFEQLAARGRRPDPATIAGRLAIAAAAVPRLATVVVARVRAGVARPPGSWHSAR